MTLFKRLRWEYEHGVGTIRGVAQKYGVHRRTVRAALKSPVPPKRKVYRRERPKMAPLIPFIDGILARLWPSSGAAERIDEALAQGARQFSHLVLATGGAKTCLAPVVLTNGGEGIGKGGPRLAVPRVLHEWQRAAAG